MEKLESGKSEREEGGKEKVSSRAFSFESEVEERRDLRKDEVIALWC